MNRTQNASSRSAWRKWLIRAGIIVVFYGLLGFFVVPAVIKSQLLKRLPALTKRQVAIKQVRFNPFVLSLTIRGLTLTEPGGEHFAGFGELYVNFQLSSIVQRKFVFDEISLRRPTFQATYLPDRSFNFANLLGQPSVRPAGPPAQPTPLLVRHFNVTDGVVIFDDLTQSPKFRTEFKPIDLNLENITTVRDKNSAYVFSARSEAGETFAWFGNVTLNPLRVAGGINLRGLYLPKYISYARDFFTARITNGRVDVNAEYVYDSSTNALNAILTNAIVQLSDLEIKSPTTNETVVAIPELSLDHIDANLLNQTARIGNIKSVGGSLLVRQETNGVINLLSYVNLPSRSAIPAASRPPAPNAPAAKPWTARIDQIAFEQYQVKLEDRKPANPAEFTLDQIDFNLKNLSTVPKTPVNASFKLRVNESGLVSAAGTATMIPPSADLQISVTNMEIPWAQPYLSQFVNLAVTGGWLDLSGRAHYALPGSGGPLLTFDGDLAVEKLTSVDRVLFKNFARWDELTVTGIKLALQPDQIQARQVKLKGLDTTLSVGADKRMNLENILRSPAGSVPAAPTPSPPKGSGSPLPNGMKLALGAFVLENASFHFSDESIEPHCEFDVEQFGGAVEGLSSRPGTTASVNITGRVDGRSPFRIAGKTNPLAQDLYADVSVSFTNTELTAFTPYCEKFGGRPLQKGKLSFAVHYLVNKKNLKAENGFFVDQLTLGPKNNSPEATSLPVKLAVALLKDRGGRISLNIPVQGRIDDPAFKLGPIIWQVVVNLMIKAAASPFALLGAAFGAGEELSYVDFQPGQSVVSAAESKKLDTLAKALYERPEVTLEISGVADNSQDRAALANARVADQVKSLWLTEQAANGSNTASLAEAQIPAPDFERLLRSLYAQTIGTNSPAATPGPEAPSAATNVTVAARAPAPAIPGPSDIEVFHLPPPHPSHSLLSLVLAPFRGFRTDEGSEPPIFPGDTPLPPANARAAKPAAPAGWPADETTALATSPKLSLAEMEAQLAKKVEITDDDLRELMRARAKQVQSLLLQSGKVGVERLFILAPKAADLSSKGEHRAKLSLD